MLWIIKIKWAHETVEPLICGRVADSMKLMRDSPAFNTPLLRWLLEGLKAKTKGNRTAKSLVLSTVLLPCCWNSEIIKMKLNCYWMIKEKKLLKLDRWERWKRRQLWDLRSGAKWRHSQDVSATVDDIFDYKTQN